MRIGLAPEPGVPEAYHSAEALGLLWAPALVLTIGHVRICGYPPNPRLTSRAKPTPASTGGAFVGLGAPKLRVLLALRVTSPTDY